MYGEGTYLLNQGRMIINTEMCCEYTWLLNSISDRPMAHPHIAPVDSHDSEAIDHQLALGTGSNINSYYWFCGPHYTAPASWLDLTV